MNKALRKHMLKTVQRFSASPSASAPANNLLELMYAVARGYNSTAPSDSDKTRKLHKDFRDNWKSQFYLGSALSGAPFHNHGPAFNVLVHGKKEWTLMPPGARFSTCSYHPRDVADHVFPCLHCVAQVATCTPTCIRSSGYGRVVPPPPSTSTTKTRLLR